MTELEKVGRDIDTLQEALRVAKLALTEPSLSADVRSRGLAAVELYERHLCELLTKRDDLRAFAED